MRHAASIFASVALLLGGCLAQGGEVLDRIVATVNGHILLQSDWEDELHYEALIAGRSPAALTDDDRKAALDRMIDQELLRQQIRSSDLEQAPAPEEIAAQMAAIRNQIPGAETDSGWNGILAQYGMTAADVERRVSLQIALTRLIDDRLRPTVQVDAKSIEDYYNNTFLPKLRQSGSKEVPLSEATPQIREVLAEQQLNDAIADWLKGLRANSQIQIQAGSPTP